MRMLKTVLLAASALVLATAASKADTFSYNGFNVIGGQQVGIVAPTVRTVNAGEIELIGAGPNAGQTLDAWCVDLINSLLGTDTYTIAPYAGQLIGGLPAALTQTQQEIMGGLILAGLAASTDGQAAVQVAIWKAEYGANFALATPGDLLDLSSATLVTLFSPGGADFNPDARISLLLDAPTVPNQTLATAFAVPTPIMGTGWLFAPGLAFFAWLVRKAKRRGQAATPDLAVA